MDTDVRATGYVKIQGGLIHADTNVKGCSVADTGSNETTITLDRGLDISESMVSLQPESGTINSAVLSTDGTTHVTTLVVTQSGDNIPYRFEIKHLAAAANGSNVRALGYVAVAGAIGATTRVNGGKATWTSTGITVIHLDRPTVEKEAVIKITTAVTCALSYVFAADGSTVTVTTTGEGALDVSYWFEIKHIAAKAVVA